MTQPFFFPPPNPPALARSIETKKKETLKDPRQNPRPVQLVLRAHGTVLTFARRWKEARRIQGARPSRAKSNLEPSVRKKHSRVEQRGLSDK
jgi:hypothetical protein